MSEGRHPSSPSPSVGIFWAVPATGEIALVTDATPLETAEPYGDFLTHSRGHYEVWEDWRRLGSAGLIRRGLPATIVLREYEEFPRGRIVFDIPAQTFIVYADRKLQSASMVERIILAFDLEGQSFVIRSDAHYRS